MELLSDFSGDSLVQDFNYFEGISRDMGDSVQHYHCENVTFADN